MKKIFGGYGMKNNKIFIIGIICLLFLFLGLILFEKSVGDYFNSPDENINSFFSKNYAETGRLYYTNPLIKIAGENALPRGFIYLNEKIISLKFPGFSFFFGGVSFFYPDLVKYLTFLVLTIGLIFLYKLSRDVLDNQTRAVIVISLTIFLPFLLYWSSQPFFENISATFFLIISIYYYLKIYDSKSLSNYLLFSIFLAVSISFRYDFALFGILFMGTTIINYQKFKIKYLLISLLSFSLVFFPMIYFNKILYGGFFNYGQKLLTNLSNTPPIKSFKNVLLNLKQIFLIFPLISLGFIGVLDSLFKGNKKIKILSSIFLIYLIFFCYIYLSEFPPKSSIAIHESFIRYILPLLLLLPIFIVVSLKNFANKKLIAIFLMIFITSSMIFVMPFIQKQYERMGKNEDIANSIIEKVPSTSVVFVYGEDKFLFPKREVISIRFFKNDTGGIDYLKVSNALEKLKESGKDIFIYGASDPIKDLLKIIPNKFEKDTEIPLYSIK